jgi:dCMP deaminase
MDNNKKKKKIDINPKEEFTSIMEDICNLEYRPNWDEYFMVLATFASKRSSCDRQNVGCIIVQDNRVATTGYNGHIAGAVHNSKVVDGHEQMTIHAEANAIADAASRGIKINGATVYVTHYPCINCAKMLIASGVKRIVYKIAYKPNEICKELYNLAGVKIEKFGE